MNGLERRIDRLEQQTGAKPGPRIIYFSNLPGDDADETPYCVKLSSDVWAHVFGPPLSAEEIHALRLEYNEKGY